MLSDPDARTIRKGELGKPTELGYIAQIAELAPNTKRGARGLILPAGSFPGDPGKNALLPQTVTELQSLGVSPKEIALGGGFNVGPRHTGSRTLRPNAYPPGVRSAAPDARTQQRCSANAPMPRAVSAISNAVMACAAPG